MNQLDPDTELSRDVAATIETVIDEIEIEQAQANGMDPNALLSMVLPRLYDKIDNDPEQAKRTLARLHLETGALLEKHDERAPEEVLNA